MADGPPSQNIIIDERMVYKVLKENNPWAEDALLVAVAQAMTETGRAVANAISHLRRLEHADQASATPAQEQAPDLDMLRSIISRPDLVSWAGQLLGPNAAAEELGVSRATLTRWRKTGAIIALQKGQRNHLIPMAQFWGSQPVLGVAAVLEMAGDPNMAWAWLMQPNPGLDGVSPIIRLRDHQAEGVFRCAGHVFGRGD